MSDHAELLARYEQGLRVRDTTKLEDDLAAALGAVIAQRDIWCDKWQHSLNQMDEVIWRAITAERRAIRAEIRVTELDGTDLPTEAQIVKVGEWLMEHRGWDTADINELSEGFNAWRALVASK